MLPSAPYGRALAVGSIIALVATGVSILYTGDVLLAIDALFVAALLCCVVGAILTRPTVSRRKEIAESDSADDSRRKTTANREGPTQSVRDDEVATGTDATETDDAGPDVIRTDDNKGHPPEEATLPSADRSPISGNPVRQYRFGIAAIVVGFTLFAWSLGLQFIVR